jgi:hypothetical protein
MHCLLCSVLECAVILVQLAISMSWHTIRYKSTKSHNKKLYLGMDIICHVWGKCIRIAKVLIPQAPFYSYRRLRNYS